MVRAVDKDASLPKFGRTGPHRDQALGLTEGQRVERHAIDDAEDGGDRADSQRDDRDARRAEGRRCAKQADAMSRSRAN
jgi:hypothetical protein